MCQRRSSTIVCDHENVGVSADALADIHRWLANVGHPPVGPHLIARADWLWTNKSLSKLAAKLKGLDYLCLTSPPGKNAADQVLSSTMQLLLSASPHTLVLLAGDHFFAGMTARFRQQRWETITIVLNRSMLSDKLAKVSDRVVTLSEIQSALKLPKAESTPDRIARPAGVAPASAQPPVALWKQLLDQLPRHLYLASRTLAKVIRLIAGCRNDGTTDWADLADVNNAVHQLPQAQRPKAAGFKSVLRLARTGSDYGLFRVRSFGKQAVTWKLRCIAPLL